MKNHLKRKLRNSIRKTDGIVTSWLSADIGGTKLAAAAWDGSHLHASSSIPTNAYQGPDQVIERLVGLLKETADKAGIRKLSGIGVACPGPLSGKRGVVIKAPNLGWENIPISMILSERFYCPVVLENDANAAALGEYTFGAGRGTESMAYITVSTGVGCGIVLDGKIWEGMHESAGELGHVVLYNAGRKCPCGRYGCLEQYASGTAIGYDVSRIMKTRGSKEPVTAKEAAALARQGDKEMLEVFRRAGVNLGRGIAILLQLMDLERIVIGGSVSQTLDLMQEGIEESIRKGSYWGRHEDWIAKAQLGGESGLLGAAVLISNTERGI